MDHFALLKVRNDVCQKNLVSCEEAFARALKNGDGLSWYQDPAAIAGVSVAAFAIGFLAGSITRR